MDLAQRRAEYAASITAACGIDAPRVQRAFATVPRERFVGLGPWKFFTAAGYVQTVSSDPLLLYDDVVIALSPEKRINNGQPSLHAKCMAAVDIQAGDRVLHIGCGSGYYTAILAEMATARGCVLAWDVEPALARAAAANLCDRTHVVVDCRSGTQPPIPTSDVIYVSAGCTRPMKDWVEALTPGGRLIFPLTPGWDYGGMLKVTRHEHRLHAQFVCACAFIPCVGGSSPAEAQGLLRAFSRGDMYQVSSLRFDAVSGEDCWFAGDGWNLH